MNRKETKILYILIILLIIYIIYKYTYIYSENFQNNIMDIEFKKKNGKIRAYSSPNIKDPKFPEFNIIYKNNKYELNDIVNILPGDTFTLVVEIHKKYSNYIIKSGSPDYNYIFLSSKVINRSRGYDIGPVNKSKVGDITYYKCNIKTIKDTAPLVPLEILGFRVKHGVFELNDKPSEMTESIYVHICMKPDIEITQNGSKINMVNNKYTLNKNNGDVTLKLLIPVAHEKIYRFKPTQITNYDDITETDKTAITTIGPLEKNDDRLKNSTKVLTYTLKLLKSGNYRYKIKKESIYVGSTIVTRSPVYDQEITFNII